MATDLALSRPAPSLPRAVELLELYRQATAWKEPVRVATTANLTQTAEQTIDGVAVKVGDRVLCTDQSTASQNGIWIVRHTAWLRALDCDAERPGKLVCGTQVTVQQGTANAGTTWRLETTGTIVVGTTSQSWVAASASGGTASTTTFTPAGGIAATNVQAAIEEVVTDVSGTYVALAGDQTVAGIKTFSSSPLVPVATAALQPAPLGQNAAGLYGNGSDGNLTVSGSTTVTGDKYYDTLTVQNGGVLTVAGGRIWCKTLCQVDAGGIITANGGDGAAAGTAGAAAPQGVYGATATGGAGGVAAGSAGGGVVSGSGGSGGAGGAGSGGAGGGSGGFSTLVGNSGSAGRATLHALAGYVPVNGNAAFVFKGGGGGGGGGGDGTAGGGGGGGGGCFLLAARSLVNNGTIRANGGAGGTPAAGNRGGGGGGGGGRVDVLYNTKTGSGTITANGGTKGLKSGTGIDGADGSAGLVNEIVNA